jgi:hypothetical protein
MLLRTPRALAAAALVLAATAVLAQTATSTLSGVVRDGSGASVVGATVTVRNVGTGFNWRAVTDGSGRYNLANLPAGEYELKVEMQGFNPTVHGGMVLTVGGAAVRDVILGVDRGRR